MPLSSEAGGEDASWNPPENQNKVQRSNYDECILARGVLVWTRGMKALLFGFCLFTLIMKIFKDTSKSAEHKDYPITPFQQQSSTCCCTCFLCRLPITAPPPLFFLECILKQMPSIAASPALQIPQFAHHRRRKKDVSVHTRNPIITPNKIQF